MNPRRLRAPGGDGGLLVDPPFEQLAARLAANRGLRDRWDHDFQGRRAGRLRAMVRREVEDRARAFLARFDLAGPPAEESGPDRPWIVTGHQPELVHPGVWIKNFAVDGLARTFAGVGLNLIVDNDLPKSTGIRVPGRHDGALRTRIVEFDAWQGEVPYEDLRVGDEEVFGTFGDRVVEALDGLVADPLVTEFWPRAVAAQERTREVGLRFTAARHAIEQEWGARNLELPLGAACETEGFLWFASHLLAQLPWFQEVHNAALFEYRQAHRIRSRNHPVPALGREGDWLEAPFWAWRGSQPRRRPLLIRQHARTMDLRIGGEREPFLELPLAPDREACCAVERLRTLPALGVRLRTRALTTTMFARLLLGDLFVHGIGGAKYDELGDEVIRRFFAIEPPTFLTLSMTLWLGIDFDPGAEPGLRRVARELRDLTFNPERHLGTPLPAPLAAEVEAKRRALAEPAAGRRDRRRQWREVARRTRNLQPFVEPLRDRLRAERDRLRAAVRDAAAARSREYAAILHDRDRLRRAFVGLPPAVADG